MIETIAVGTDGSDTASKAVDFALDLAEKYGSHVVVASSYRPVRDDRLKQEQKDAPADIQWSINPMEDVEATLRGAEAKAKARGLTTTSDAREGDPADVLCSIAAEHNADLLVVGNKGMTGAKRFLLGSVPNKVSHHAPCSVLIIRTT